MTGPATDRPAPALGLVYLLHFDELYVPYPGAPACACAGHYTGFARGGPRALKRRLRRHGTAGGARLMLAVTRAGITWQLARTWPGDWDLERRLKAQGGASRRCPLCGVTPRPGPLPHTADGRVSRSLTTDAQKSAAGLMTAARRGHREAAPPARPRPPHRRRRPVGAPAARLRAREHGMTEPPPRQDNSKRRNEGKAAAISRIMVGTGRLSPPRLSGSRSIDLVVTSKTSVYAACGAGTAPARRRANGHRAGHDGTLASTRITCCTEALKAREKRSGPSRGPRTYDNRISVHPDLAPWFGRLVCEAPDTSPQRTLPWALR